MVSSVRTDANDDRSLTRADLRPFQSPLVRFLMLTYWIKYAYLVHSASFSPNPLQTQCDLCLEPRIDITYVYSFALTMNQTLTCDMMTFALV